MFGSGVSLSQTETTQQILNRLKNYFPGNPPQSPDDFLKKTYQYANTGDSHRILADNAMQKGVINEELTQFANNWISVFCNEDENTTTIPGGGIYDQLHRELKEIKNPTQSSTDIIINKYITDTLTTASGEKRDSIKKVYIEAFSPKRTSKFCKLDPETIQQCQRNIKDEDEQNPIFIRLRTGKRDNAMEYPLSRYLWLRDTPDPNIAQTAHDDLIEFVRKKSPKKDLLNGQAKMPYQTTGKEYLFQYFTNRLGMARPKHNKKEKCCVWDNFDKAAFKRAAEEVFKYQLRTEARSEKAGKRQAYIRALESNGEWTDEGNRKQLGGIGNDPRAAIMRKLLDELSEDTTYTLRTATIGSWTDLREEFLEIARKAQPNSISEQELQEAIHKVRESSSGEFGSGAFYKKLCEADNHILWLNHWPGQQLHHPKDFISWWARYSEAKAKLHKIWDPRTQQPEPISFTWPGTKNRFGETSFRPFDFKIILKPEPAIELFDQADENAKIEKIECNKTLNHVDAGEPLYPLTLLFRRLKRDQITNPQGDSIEAKYITPLLTNQGPEFTRGEKERSKPLTVNAAMLPADSQGRIHFKLAFQIDSGMQDNFEIKWPETGLSKPVFCAGPGE